MPILSIPAPQPPAPGQPAPALVPPTSGNWLRGADDSLTPADEATARTAGLWAEPEAPAGAATDSEGT